MGESTDNRLKNLEERVEDIITTIVELMVWVSE